MNLQDNSDLLSESQSTLQSADQVFSPAQVESALDGMAAAISTRLAEKNPIVLCVIIGGIIPTGKLLTRLRFPLQLDYVHATRYRGGTRGGDLHWIRRPEISLMDRTVLLIDDVLDEGYTLEAIIKECRTKGASEVLTAVLVDKKIAERPGLSEADFVGLTADDRYLIGMGMDYKGYLRNLDGIYAVNTHD